MISTVTHAVCWGAESDVEGIKGVRNGEGCLLPNQLGVWGASLAAQWDPWPF